MATRKAKVVCRYHRGFYKLFGHNPTRWVDAVLFKILLISATKRFSLKTLLIFQCLSHCPSTECARSLSYSASYWAGCTRPWKHILGFVMGLSAFPWMSLVLDVTVRITMLRSYSAENVFYEIDVTMNVNPSAFA